MAHTCVRKRHSGGRQWPGVEARAVVVRLTNQSPMMNQVRWLGGGLKRSPPHGQRVRQVAPLLQMTQQVTLRQKRGKVGDCATVM